MKKIILSCFIVALIIGLAGGVGLAEEAEEEEVDKIVVRTSDDPMTLDPFMVGGDAYAWDLSYLMNAYLFVPGPGGEDFIPDAAESWETPDDETIIFNIREGMTFHDGEPLTADDVIFTFEKNLDPDFASYWHAELEGHIDTVEKVDDYTVRVELEEPYAPIMYSFLFPIVPEHAWEEKGEDFPYEPVGAGPFKLEEWEIDDHHTFTAFDDFWDGRPEIDEIEFRVMDYDTALMAFLEEDIDVLAPGTEDMEMVEDHDNLERVHKPGTSWYYFGINLNREPLDNKKVRQAISYAIDREAIIDAVWDGLMEPATGPIVPLSWAYTDDVKTYEYDPVEAVQLIREAGYEPEEIEFTIKGAFTTVLEMVQEQLMRAGIEADIEIMEFGLLTEDVEAEDFDMHFRAWTRQMDPAGGIDRQFMSDTNQRIAGYSNPRVDELAEKATSTMDIDQRREYYHELQEILAEELPVIFLSYGYHQTAYNTRIENFDYDPFYSYRTYRHMSLEE